MKNKVCIFFIVCPFFLSAGEFCDLQPEGFDGGRQSAAVFEKNIESKVSEIYRTRYPLVVEKLKILEEFQKRLEEIENRYTAKYVRRSRRHPKSRIADLSRRRQRREFLFQLIERNIQSDLEFNEYLSASGGIRSLSFDVYRNFLDEVFELKEQIEEINTSLLEIQSFGFLQPPDFGFSVRDRRFYGRFQMEGLFRVPKDDLLKLPFLKIGFETSPHTVIYSCVHLDEFAPEKNRIYVYFLNTTKLYTIHWKDFFMRPSVAVKHLLTLNQEPQAVISPLPVVLNPLAAASTALGSLGKFEQLGGHASFNQLMGTVDRLNVLDFSANLNPILSVIKNNVQVGIQGFMIQPDKLQIRYAGTTLYGLINFDLAVQNQKADFSSFMNMMTLDEMFEK